MTVHWEAGAVRTMRRARESVQDWAMLVVVLDMYTNLCNWNINVQVQKEWEKKLTGTSESETHSLSLEVVVLDMYTNLHNRKSMLVQ